MSSHKSSDDEDSDLDFDFDDLDFFDQDLMDKFCDDQAVLKREALAISLEGAQKLFLTDGGWVVGGCVRSTPHSLVDLWWHDDCSSCCCSVLRI
jgi:hypothetical protein